MVMFNCLSKMVTHCTGRSACTTTAYMGCSRIYSDYDSIQHDYTCKVGLLWKHVFRPPQVPFEWQKLEQFWNTVEECKRKNSCLDRMFIAALPVEQD